MSVVLFPEKNKLEGLQIARAVAALSIAYFHSWVAALRSAAL
jgi:peptidoglycan/LPS O-acetylase OafA/YrhL